MRMVRDPLLDLDYWVMDVYSDEVAVVPVERFEALLAELRRLKAACGEWPGGVNDNHSPLE